MEYFGIIVPCILIIVVFWACLYPLTPEYKRRVLNKQPIITCTGKAIDKYMVIVSLGRSSKSVPHIAFETAEGQRMDVELEVEHYALIRTNEKGTLRYRQYKGKNYFESFIKEAEH